MKIQAPNARPNLDVAKENVSGDKLPEFLTNEASEDARARLLAATAAARQPTPAPKITVQPEVAAVLPGNKLEAESSTSISTRMSDSEISARATSNLSADWVRQELPSHSIPYKGEEIFLRTFGITVMSRVHAAMRNENFTLLIDALNHCINIDIRRLTPEDFDAVLYWLRLNSYVRKPYTLPWKSKYGNENVHKIKESNLEFQELTMTTAEYAEWQAKGICFPTLRDMELMQADALPEDDKWRIEYSQYVYVAPEFDENGNFITTDYTQKKLDAFEKGGVAMLEDITDFQEEIGHGVVEKVIVTDEKFEPKAAVEYLREVVEDSRGMIKAIMEANGPSETNVGLIGMSKRADELEIEANLIQKALDENRIYTPGKETITLSINAMHFFP